MDTTLKSSLTFLTLILLVSFFVSLAPKVSEARVLFSPLQGKGVTGEVNGVFRTLKGDGPPPGVGHRFIGGMGNSGPSPGVGHGIIEGMKDSGPSSGGVGHRFIGGMQDSGPSPGVGHMYIGGIKDSGPSSGGVGHKYSTNNNNKNS